VGSLDTGIGVRSVSVLSVAPLTVANELAATPTLLPGFRRRGSFVLGNRQGLTESDGNPWAASAGRHLVSLSNRPSDFYQQPEIQPAMTSKTIFQHRFDNVEEYLHHRPPYLLVHKIVDIQDRQILTRHRVSEDAFFLQGHFPGAPIMPGAMMQEFSTQSAAILIAANHNPMEKYDTQDPFFNEYALGVLVKVKQAKYRSFARPGDLIEATVRIDEQVGSVFDFSCTLICGDQKIMQNKFQLTNIRSDVLQGKA
jgi:3-hydroxyacyl-[acyl-carrier-protein] dehydratase